MLRHLLLIIVTALALPSLAQTTAVTPAPAAMPTPVASDLTRSCVPSGVCTLSCQNQQGLVVINEQATRAVRIISLSNGNTEFRLDNGAEGVNVVLVAKENLVCKLVGAT